MSMERTNVLLRPSLRFISTLPTLKLKEDIWENTVSWKVKLDEPVMILCRGYPILNNFYVVAETLKDFTPTGWRYDLKIGIYTSVGSFLFEPVDEDFYLHKKWWDWLVGVNK